MNATLAQAAADLNIPWDTLRNRLQECKARNVYSVSEDLTQVHKEKREHWCVAKKEYMREDPFFSTKHCFRTSHLSLVEDVER